MTGNYPRIANFDFYITKAFSYLDLTALTFGINQNLIIP